MEEQSQYQDFLLTLKRAWINETFAPEILMYEKDAIEELMDICERQKEYIDSLKSEPPSKVMSLNPALFYEMELERVRYLLKRYLRTRLEKIENHSSYILQNMKDRLSAKEEEYLVRFDEIAEKYETTAYLDQIPEKAPKNQPFQIPRPYLNVPVTVYIPEDKGPHRLQIADDEQVVLHPNSTMVISYHHIKSLLYNKQLIRIMPHHVTKLPSGEIEFIVLSNSTSSVKIYSYGATITSWILNGKEILFVSKKALFDQSKPIRGGIPLVFPQFGPGAIPTQHGFARTSRWTWKENVEEKGDTITTVFQLKESQQTLSVWNYKFELEYTIQLNKDNLTTTLKVVNTDEKEFKFDVLFHTYLLVPDISHVKVDNLHGKTFFDGLVENGKVNGQKEERKYVQVNQEVDRIYHDIGKSIQVLVDDHQNAVQLEQSGFVDAVVWNPWIEKAKKMADFGDEEYKQMICVELGNVHKGLALLPKQQWTGSQTIKRALL